MTNDEHLYESVTLDKVIERIEDAAQKPEAQIAKQLHESPPGDWDPQKAQYEVAGWLAKGLFCAFAGVIALNGILMLVILIRNTNGTMDEEQTSLVIGLGKDLLPFIATPLGVALGFYFRES